ARVPLQTGAPPYQRGAAPAVSPSVSSNGLMAFAIPNTGHCLLYFLLAPGTTGPAARLALLHQPVHLASGHPALPIPSAATQAVALAKSAVSRRSCRYRPALGDGSLLAAPGRPEHSKPELYFNGAADTGLTFITPVLRCDADFTPNDAAPLPVPDLPNSGTALGNAPTHPGHRRRAV